MLEIMEEVQAQPELEPEYMESLAIIRFFYKAKHSFHFS